MSGAGFRPEDQEVAQPGVTRGTVTPTNLLTTMQLHFKNALKPNVFISEPGFLRVLFESASCFSSAGAALSGVH